LETDQVLTSILQRGQAKVICRSKDGSTCKTYDPMGRLAQPTCHLPQTLTFKLLFVILTLLKSNSLSEIKLLSII
jgi:hypothetical protein